MRVNIIFIRHFRASLLYIAVLTHSLDTLSHTHLHRQVNINFSLILDHPTNSKHLHLKRANEGVLLKANTFNSSHYLHFYFNRLSFQRTGNRIPLVSPNGSMLRLTYMYDNHITTIVVPGTLDKGEGLLNFSLDNSQLVNRIVTLTWEQYSYCTPTNRSCDMWSLDNVAVTLHNNCGMKTIFSDDFDHEDQQ